MGPPPNIWNNSIPSERLSSHKMDGVDRMSNKTPPGLLMLLQPEPELLLLLEEQLELQLQLLEPLLPMLTPAKSQTCGVQLDLRIEMMVRIYGELI